MWNILWFTPPLLPLIKYLWSFLIKEKDLLRVPFLFLKCLSIGTRCARSNQSHFLSHFFPNHSKPIFTDLLSEILDRTKMVHKQDDPDLLWWNAMNTTLVFLFLSKHTKVQWKVSFLFLIPLRSDLPLPGTEFIFNFLLTSFFQSL